MGGAGIVTPPRPDGGGGAPPGPPPLTKGPPPDWNCGATCFRDTIVPPNAIDGFGGPETMTGKPVIAYPLDQSMHPNNVGDITIQWRRANTTQTVFRIEVRGTTTYTFYVPCQTPMGGLPEECLYHPHEGDWRDITYNLHGTEADLVVSAQAGTNVANSAPVHLRFTSADVAGRLYY